MINSSITKLTAAAALAVCMTACTAELPVSQGSGRVKISAALNSDVAVVSRSRSAQELSDGCIVWISNSRGLVREYTGLNNLPADGIALTADHYKAEAWAGVKSPASWTDRWYEGAEEFDVTAGTTTPVQLTCHITNTVVSVQYDQAVDQALTDCSVAVGHSKGELLFGRDEQRRGYFSIPKDDDRLSYTVSGTKADGSAYTRTAYIANPKPATEYVLHVKYSATEPDAVGGAFITVEVDERAIVVEDQIVIAVAPQIAGTDFDIDQTLMCEPGAVNRRSLYIAASSALQSVTLEGNLLGNILAGGATSCDLRNLGDAQLSALTGAGINCSYAYNAADDISNLRINFEASLTNSLPKGDYSFTVRATDANGLTMTKEWRLSVNNAPVLTLAANPVDVYATRATLHATVAKPAQSYGFAYRLRGQSTWTCVPAEISGQQMQAIVTGLQPNSVYEFAATADEFTSPAVMTLTTEPARQMPNSGFEDWDLTSEKYYQIFAQGGQKFWDCGNKGSSTMNKNVTVPEYDVVHSGQRALRMVSQFVGVASIGKFAAGNVFIGDFLATEGTNGVLGWGREWNSRPTALRAWVKYMPAQVQYTGGGGFNKGDMDQGAIFIAILDSSTETELDYTYPVMIRTKTGKAFDRNADKVIGFGEHIFTQATAGDGLVEVIIPIDYRRTDVKAGNIVLCASSSKNGDYFEGGPSVMIIDDFELIY